MKKFAKIFDICNLFCFLITFFFFLLIIHKVPQQIPMHFDAYGNVDRLGNKLELIILPCLALVNWIILNIVKKVISNGNNYRIIIMCDIFSIFINAVIIWSLYYIALKTYEDNAIDMRKAIFYLFILISILISWMTKDIKMNNKVGLRNKYSLKNQSIWESCQKIGFVNSLIFNMIITCFVYHFDEYIKIIISVFVGYVLMALSGIVLSYYVSEKEKNKYE